MSDKNRTGKALSTQERAHLAALAASFPFWADVAARAKDFEYVLTDRQYERLREAAEKYPSLLNGHAIRNRRGKDGSIRCWRSRDGCRSVATHVVDSVGVCSAHIDVQEADAERHRSSHPKPTPAVRDVSTRTPMSVLEMAKFLDPTAEGEE